MIHFADDFQNQGFWKKKEKKSGHCYAWVIQVITTEKFHIIWYLTVLQMYYRCQLQLPLLSFNCLLILYQMSVVSQTATFPIDWRSLYLSGTSRQHISCSPAAGSTSKSWFQFPCGQSDASVWKYSPAKAEEGKVDAQQCGHHMPHKRTCLAGVQIEPEPHGCEQGTELTYYEVHLKRKRDRKIT